MIRWFSLLLTAIVLAGCVSRTEPNEKPITREKAIQIASTKLLMDDMEVLEAELIPNHRIKETVMDVWRVQFRHKTDQKILAIHYVNALTGEVVGSENSGEHTRTPTTTFVTTPTPPNFGGLSFANRKFTWAKQEC